MNWIQHSPNIWCIAEDAPPRELDAYPKWFIAKRSNQFWIYDYAMFVHSKYPDLDAAKFALLVMRAAAVA